MRRHVQLGAITIAVLLSASAAWGVFQGPGSKNNDAEKSAAEKDRTGQDGKPGQKQSPEKGDNQPEGDNDHQGQPPGADPDSPKKPDAEQTAVVRVVVTGGGKAIAQARVRVSLVFFAATFPLQYCR
jgi:hypothetical protein